MTTTIFCGHVSLTHTPVKLVADRVQDEDGLAFGRDYYHRKFVRLTISGPSSIVDVVKARAVDVSFGYPDPPNVCRIWLPYWVSDYQTLVNLCSIVEAAGFEQAPEVDASGMSLLECAYESVRYGLGYKKKNWTKKMTEAEYHGLLAHCAICSNHASSFLCGECQEAMAVTNEEEQKCKCEPDLERMFDCNCGTNDSYCIKCKAYMSCEICA